MKLRTERNFKKMLPDTTYQKRSFLTVFYFRAVSVFSEFAGSEFGLCQLSCGACVLVFPPLSSLRILL